MPDSVEKRPAGRLWVVRIVPRGRPAEGVVTLQCSARACAAGTAGPIREPAAARTAALTHLAVHARTAGPPPPSAACSYRDAGCAWHPRNGHCGGPVRLIVAPDRLRRVWRLAEVCTRCAAAVPNAKPVPVPVPAAVPPDRPGRVPANAAAVITAPVATGGRGQADSPRTTVNTPTGTRPAVNPAPLAGDSIAKPPAVPEVAEAPESRPPT